MTRKRMAAAQAPRTPPRLRRDLPGAESSRGAPYTEERRLLRQGYSAIAGLDEAGRGPWAGPVVAGVVVFPPNPRGAWVGEIRDSKAMTPAQRERSHAAIAEHSAAFAVGKSEAREIDAVGIAPATRLAMRRALTAMGPLPQFLLLDAFPLPEVDIPQKAIIRGDAASLSIAAASIMAKVARDRIMVELDARHPEYGFARHKGYGTPEHATALMKFGPCAEHRYSFKPVRDVRRAP